MLRTIIAAATAVVLMAGAATIWTSTGKVEASTPPAATKGDRLDIRPTGRTPKHPTGQARDIRLVALSQSIV
jgi:hypothetical protein